MGSWGEDYGPVSFTASPVIKTIGPKDVTITDAADGYVTISWEPLAEADYYQLYVGQPDGSGGYLTAHYDWHAAGDICQDACEVQVLLTQNGTYEWYLNFYDATAAQIGVWNSGETFTLTVPGPALPADDFVVSAASGADAQINWTPAANAGWYQIYVGHESSGFPVYFGWVQSSTVCGQEFCGLNFDLPAGAPDGGYWAWMQAWSPGGLSEGGLNDLGWAGPVRFTLPFSS
jgi:hypothetical protein